MSIYIGLYIPWNYSLESVAIVQMSGCFKFTYGIMHRSLGKTQTFYCSGWHNWKHICILSYSKFSKFLKHLKKLILFYSTSFFKFRFVSVSTCLIKLAAYLVSTTYCKCCAMMAINIISKLQSSDCSFFRNHFCYLFWLLFSFMVYY